MSTYAEKLKDPRWQKKRLKVLERDGWTCLCCGEGEDTLHVHHLKYAKSGNPWDAPVKDLETLCENCHKNKKELEEKRKLLLGKIESLPEDYILDTLLLVVDLVTIGDAEFCMFVNSLYRLCVCFHKDGEKKGGACG